MTQKVLLVASHGGHWVQMRKMSQAFKNMDVHYMTTTSKVINEVYPNTLHVVPDAHLDEKIKLLLSAVRIFSVLIRLRPNIVMSTGAAPGFITIVLAKLLGAKTIWVDSIANIEKLSVSGKYVKRFADLWLTQWEHLAKPEGPFYKGSVL